MNQQRLQAYVRLIQQLLACPSGEEWILLRQHEALVTPELVQVMEQVATHLSSQGNPREAKFLHNLAGQIHHLFVAQTISPTPEDDQKQAYLDLIKALLACPKGSESELLTANQALIDPGLVHMMQQVAAQMAANDDQETARYLQHWAMELNRLWVQQHHFQPVLKQEPEPKPFNHSLIAPPIPSPVPFTHPSSEAHLASMSQPQVTAPTEEEDVWAELSGDSAPETPSIPIAPLPLPAPVQEPAAIPVGTDSALTQINRHLETIAVAINKLSETLTPLETRPADPLWYMDVLERACAGNWILTSSEIHKLIGVQPTSPRGSDTFQRGCWVFAKAGKLGSQTAWRVTKEA